MGIVELCLIAVCLSMDAFAVAICKGLKMRRVELKDTLLVALAFGGFQALMPMIGWVLGSQFEKYIVSVDHWIAFVLMAIIGGKMIYEAFGKEEDEDCGCSIGLDLKELLLLAFATSIDALAVGITLALRSVNIIYSAGVIGSITFVICVAGVVIGNKFGAKYKNKAQILGGAILILIGAKILLEGLGILK